MLDLTHSLLVMLLAANQMPIRILTSEILKEFGPIYTSLIVLNSEDQLLLLNTLMPILKDYNLMLFILEHNI